MKKARRQAPRGEAAWRQLLADKVVIERAAGQRALCAC